MLRRCSRCAALTALRRVVDHLRNITDGNEPSSSATGSGDGDDELSALTSRTRDVISGVPNSMPAAPTASSSLPVSAADAAATASSLAALGERQRQCHSIVKTLTEQQQLLHQAIDEEVSRARAQAFEAASEWTAAYGTSMRLAQQQLQASQRTKFIR